VGGAVNAAQLLSPELLVVYDLRDPIAWQPARRHRAFWGKLYTDIYPLDYDHVALVFRSAGKRWQAWERVRLEWILKDRERVA
jgi:hypothetical protein